MEFRNPDGKLYTYRLENNVQEPASESKLARFESKLQDLRIKWRDDPYRRHIYHAQAKMIQAGIDIIKKKLNRIQLKI